MRIKTVIALLLFAFIFVMAGSELPASQKKKKKAEQHDSIMPADTAVMADTVAIAAIDTTKMDSLQLAIYHHNKAVDDSIRLDSINRQRATGINSPVNYTANDSLVYDATTKTARLYGSSTVKYENMDLASEKIHMSLDSSIVHATGVVDTTDASGKRLTGTPVFKMGKDEYESDTMAFNFKTQKGLITNVNTKQQEGFLRSEISKRNANGDIYLQHGRYTTCDAKHPDFYIALSRAKVRPGKDVTFGTLSLPMCRCHLPFHTVSSHSRRAIQADSSCRHTVMRATAASICATEATISP